MAGRTDKQTVKMYISKNVYNGDIETSFIDSNAFGYHGQWPCDLGRDLYAKIAFSDFVATGAILFHKHISFNLKSAPVGKLEDFFSNCKNSEAILPKFDCFVGWRHGSQAIQNSDGCLVYIFSFLAHLSWRPKWAIVTVHRPSSSVRRGPSVNFHIFNFFSRTDWWILMKLGRDEVLMVPYKCCCFSARSAQIQGGAKNVKWSPSWKKSFCRPEGYSSKPNAEQDLEACGKKYCYF